MRLITEIRDKFYGQPTKVKVAAGFLTVAGLTLTLFMIVAIGVELGVVGSLVGLGLVALVAGYVWSIITIADSTL